MTAVFLNAQKGTASLDGVDLTEPPDVQQAQPTYLRKGYSRLPGRLLVAPFRGHWLGAELHFLFLTFFLDDM